jgi:hypothetical protein
MKPGDFLLGVLDFFAILLPGMMVTWLALQYVPPSILRDALSFQIEATPQPNAWVLAVAYLLASYTLGHFVFMVGSGLDPSYDRWRRSAKPRTADATYLAAKDLHKKLNKELFHDGYSTLKWARVYIQVHAADARVEIDRLEADQKFFRSLVIVAIAFAAHFVILKGALVLGLVAVVLGVLAYQRYVDQRWKMTELIYATVVIVHQAIASGVRSERAAPDRGGSSRD